MDADQVTIGARALGLPQVPAALLTSLVTDGPASQAALSVRLGVTPSTVCRAVRVLDDMGLVETMGPRRSAMVRPVPFGASLPALVDRFSGQLVAQLDELKAACALLGVPIAGTDLTHRTNRPLQPIPVGSCERPYIVPQTGYEGGDFHWRLLAAKGVREVVLSARGSAVQAPGVQRLMTVRRPGKIRIVVTSCGSMDEAWRRRVHGYVTAGFQIRVTPGRSAPFMIVDEQRVNLNVVIAGEQRQVWVYEPEQVAGLIRLFAALWADGDSVAT